MSNIVKDFPGIRVLDHVNLEARAGEVLALVGENGAGKSTLMKILSGVYPFFEYQGDIFINNQLVRFQSTKDAEAKRIAVIYQEFNLIADLSVAENIFLDRHFTDRLGKINWAKLYQESRRLLKQLNLSQIDPTRLVKELSTGNQQMIEIAKALSFNAKIIIFDEPTSALTEPEKSHLFKVIEKLKREQVCVLYISHQLEEVEKIADRVIILKDGKRVGKIEQMHDITIDEVIFRMVGKKVRDYYPGNRMERGRLVLEVKNFSVAHPHIRGKKKVNNVSFSVYEGEILGITGLMGSGRSELVTAIFGALPGDSSGEIYLDHEKTDIRSPRDAIENGISLVTEDRKILGLVSGQSVINNMTMSSFETITNQLGIISKKKERRIGGKFINKLDIRPPNPDIAIDLLSGGNQQKVILAKWLNTYPRLLILDEPTREIDVSSKVEIYKAVNQLLEKNVAILFVSSDLNELLGMCDRILVLCEGEVAADLRKEETSKDEIMSYAAGKMK